MENEQKFVEDKMEMREDMDWMNEELWLYWIDKPIRDGESQSPKFNLHNSKRYLNVL